MDKIISVTIEVPSNEVTITILNNGDVVAEVTKGEMAIEQMTSLLQQVVNVLPK